MVKQFIVSSTAWFILHGYVEFCKYLTTYKYLHNMAVWTQGHLQMVVGLGHTPFRNSCLQNLHLMGKVVFNSKTKKD